MNTATQTRTLPSGPSRNLAVAALLLAGLASCNDSGGNSTVKGGGGGPGGPTMRVDFSVRTDLFLGSAFLGDLAHQDLDLDGLEDLIETNFLPMKVTIARGNADGSFTTVAQLDTIGHAWAIDLGDLDGNGLDDIAVACREYQGTGQPAVQVFLNGPNPGEFLAAPITLTTAVDPTDIVCAPVTGMAGDPGPVELFVCLRDADEVARMRLDAAGALMQTGALDSSSLGGAGGAYSAAVVDLGADGLLDLVVGERDVPGGQPDRIIDYPRTVAGFQDPNPVTSPVFVPWVDNAGDTDANGFDDVSVAQGGADEALLLAADGAGLSQMVAIDFGGATTSLIFPDLDGDGFAEAVGTTLFENSVQLHRGAGPNVWDAPVNYNVGPVPRAIGTFLLPGDSIPELLCGNANDLSIMIGLGNAEFRAAKGYDTLADGPNEIETADLDNDGDADAVTISRNHDSISFLEGGGDLTFATEVVLPLMPTALDEPGHVVIVDLNVDGDLDVLTSVVELDEVRLYRGDGTVDGYSDPLPKDIFPTGDRPLGIDAADLDGDTQPDLLVCNSGDGTIQTLLNIGGGELDPQPPIAVGFEPQGVLLAELDGDGDIDGVLFGEDDSGGSTTYLVAVVENDSSGVFAVGDVYVIGGPSDNLEMGDFDEDGRIDIVVGQTEIADDVLYVLMNLGGLTFDVQAVQVAVGPVSPAVADLNGDAHLDILVATTPGLIKILLGDGTGAFPVIEPPGGELPAPTRPLGLSLGDLNGDQLEDLAIVSTLTPFVWVARNVSVPIP